MLKECVILNGQIVNIGEWDYQIQQVRIGEDEPPVYEDMITNPLPEGATIEHRDFEYDPDRGWYEVGTVTPPTAEDRLATMESALMELLLGGL